MQAETRYAQLGRDRIAYQVIGQGPPDLVMTTASFGGIDVAWEDPGLALFYRTLASFSRLILLNRRGTGASDPLPPDALPPWESYAEELEVLLDEVGSQRAALLAIPVEHVRYLAERIPGTRLVELPGADVSIIWETLELVLDQVEELRHSFAAS